MIARKRIISCFLLFTILLYQGCSQTGAPANNTSVNVGLNNSNHNANSNTITTMPNPITTDVLKGSLKERLRKDKEKVLTPKDWEGDRWLQLRLGLFYKNDEEFIRDAVCDVTNQLLGATSLRLTEVSQRALRNGLGKDTKCVDAVDKMLFASQSNESIFPPSTKP